MHEYLEKRYALALYNIAERKNQVDEYLSEISDLVDILDSDTDLQKIVLLPQISTTKKKEIITNVFQNKVNEDILSFLILLLEKKRFMELGGISKAMKEIHLQKNNTVIANVVTVIPLNNEERNSLREKLSTMYNKKIIFEEKLDSEIIGGVFVRIGDDVIDGTVKSKIFEMKRLMLKRE